MLEGKPNIAPPKVAVIYLYKRSGEVLLQHRTDNAPRYPGYWSPFGGSVEEGETPDEAIRREALEEIGYRLQAPQLFRKYIFHHEGVDFDIHAFTEAYDGTRLILGEGQGMGWFDERGRAALLMLDLDRSLSRDIGAAAVRGNL